MQELFKSNESLETLKTQYEQDFSLLVKEIGNLKQPLVHGTTSEMLDGILKYGLKKMVPEDGVPYKNWGEFYGTISAMDAKINLQHALYGSYFFCRKYTSDLSVTFEKMYNKSYFIDRIIPGVYSQVKATKDELEEALNKYRLKPKHLSWPVVIIFDGDNEVNGEHWNPEIPEEFNISSTINSKKIKLLLVPEKFIPEVSRALEYFKIDNVKIYPIECLEV